MNKWIVGMLAVVFLLGMNGISNAMEEKDWHLEVTPYLWMSGIKGTVKAGGQSEDVNVNFNDLLDKTDAAVDFLIVADYKRMVLWTQYDYFSLSDDSTVKVNGQPLADVSLNSRNHFLAVAGGWKFDGPFNGSKIDVLAGVRYFHMANRLRINSIGADGSVNITAGVVVLRPSTLLFAEKLHGRLRFNPTISIGGGDQVWTYELQPQLQVNITENVAARLGYRRLYYNYNGDRVNFDGSFHGFMVGLGVMI